MSVIYRAVLICPDPCSYCREVRDGGRIVLDQRTFHSREFAELFGRGLASKVYGSEHRVEIEQAQAPVWTLTSGEPAHPLPCSNCGMSYDACTRRVRRARGSACCPTCQSVVTHNQNEWERWDREQRRQSNPVGPDRPVHTLMQPRWASVSKREWPATGQYRHLVKRGHHTSACGTTALPASIWRGNTTKPPCPECLRKNGETP